MELHNEFFSVSVNCEHPCQLIDTDFVLNPLRVDPENDYCMARVIRIENCSRKTRNIALLDRGGSINKSCAILTDHILTMILFDAIVQIDLNSESILQLAQCDHLGGLFEIHLVENGYILYGECSVFCYDFHLNQVWEFSARDILVSREGSRSFWIDNGDIHCLDWLGWHYVLDLDGNLISERHITKDI